MRYLAIIGLFGIMPWATHAAELPQNAVLHYTASYGFPATMTFTRQSNNRYQIVAEIKVWAYPIKIESSGIIQGNLLKPSYYRDMRNGKTYAEAKFQPNSITYGKTGEQTTETTSHTILDLFSLSWQLAATDGKLPNNIKITNGKRIYAVNGLNRIGSQTFALQNGLRTPVQQYRVTRGDDIVHYAFAPKLGNIPTQISYTDNGKTYRLKLVRLILNGKEVKP